MSNDRYERIREAFDEISGLCRHLRQGGPAPEDLQDLSDALDEAVGIAANMLRALAQQPAAPSGDVNVAGMPEFDGLLDHIYEYGTASEGVIEKANAFALAVIARYAPQQPAARPPKPTECMNGCPDRQVCDHCQWPPGPDQQPVAVDGSDAQAAEIKALRAEVERLNRILGRIVEGDGDSTLTIRAGTDAFAAAREYLSKRTEQENKA